MYKNHVTESTELRPTNHYLDLIAKVHSKGGSISDLQIARFENKDLVSFFHNYASIDTSIKEEILYSDKQILRWSIFVDGKENIVFSED